MTPSSAVQEEKTPFVHTVIWSMLAWRRGSLVRRNAESLAPTLKRSGPVSLAASRRDDMAGSSERPLIGWGPSCRHVVALSKRASVTWDQERKGWRRFGVFGGLQSPASAFMEASCVLLPRTFRGAEPFMSFMLSFIVAVLLSPCVNRSRHRSNRPRMVSGEHRAPSAGLFPPPSCMH